MNDHAPRINRREENRQRVRNAIAWIWVLSTFALSIGLIVWVAVDVWTKWT